MVTPGSVKNDDCDEEMSKPVDDENHEMNTGGNAHESKNSDLQEQILTTAVIPTAGYGTRLFPASWAVRTKGLIPIVDTDGYAKPILLHLAEQADEAGLDRITIIAAPGDQANAVSELFSKVPAPLYKRLKPGFRDVADRIERVGNKVKIALQTVAEGFGHAVSCGFSDDEAEWKPFVLLLGDVVFAVSRGPSDVSPVRQIVRAFERHGGRMCVIGVTKMSVKDAKAYGVVTMKPNGVDGGGVNDDDSEEIAEMVEKPDTETAQAMADENEECDVILGPYALTREVMVALKRNVKNKVLDGGEIQLTSALVEVMHKSGMRAVRLHCAALDTGNAKEYVKTFARMQDDSL